MQKAPYMVFFILNFKIMGKIQYELVVEKKGKTEIAKIVEKAPQKAKKEKNSK